MSEGCKCKELVAVTSENVLIERTSYRAMLRPDYETK